jgi:ribosomal protein L7Ae-like RNA K-turn-binding protein
MNPKVYGFLGLLNRGGKLLIGSSLLDHMERAKLILLAEDASSNTKKAALDKAKYRDIPVLSLPPEIRTWSSLRVRPNLGRRGHR